MNQPKCTLKRTFVARWREPYEWIVSRYYATPRSRVAYLLRAARSRGGTIHRMRTASGWNYEIGELCLSERHAYHKNVL